MRDFFKNIFCLSVLPAVKVVVEHVIDCGDCRLRLQKTLDGFPILGMLGFSSEKIFEQFEGFKYEGDRKSN